jgi:signal peptidase I
MPTTAPRDPPTGPVPRFNWWKRLFSKRVVVHDESMAPALLPGDRLLVDRKAYRRTSPAPGDIVVLFDPEGSERWLIKRVAGVGPGRFWRSRSGLIAAAAEAADEVPPMDSVEVITLAGSMVYVTGDAAAARDSRQFGPVPFQALIGRAKYRYAPAGRAGPL